MNVLQCLVLCAALAGQAESEGDGKSPKSEPAGQFAVGSKAFTESVILGEIATLLGREDGYRVQHKDQLGGTVVVWRALLRGEIDVYPEYTGTLTEELFKDDHLESLKDLREALARHDVRMTDPLGFNNTYGIGMREDVARRLGITKISDLRKHPDFRFGFSNEFMERSEGWPTLRVDYDLPQTDVRGLSHDLAYGALVGDDIQAMDVYLTDPKIEALNLRVLEDDLSHFPLYEAVYLYRADLERRAPRWVASLENLAGAIDRDEMVSMNSQVEARRDVSEARVAADFLERTFGIHPEVIDEGLFSRIARYTRDHLFLVVVSMTAAILVSVPLGVLAAKIPPLGHAVLTVAEVIQTIPGLALLVLLMPVVASIGLNAVGPWPAIIALFLYSLLPIIRNTFTGMRDVPASLRESAAVLGLTPLAQLRLVELPMASSMILAGIKTTAAINVGYATLGGLIGAGGYGEPIMTGLRLGDPYLMLEGAIPAAILALVVKGVFELAERFLVPRGLRVSTAA
jgi:osmoprotectant transport system permease protein